MENDVTNAPVVEHPIVEVVLDGETPAQGAEAQKPEEPVPAADEQKAEESAEQKEARKQSRRSAARARDAAALAEAQTTARLLRERLDRLEKPPEVQSEPKRESFDSLEAFIEARAEFRATQTAQKVIDADRKERQQQETQFRAQESERKVSEDWQKAEDAFRKEAKDYDKSVADFIDSDLADLDVTTRRAILRRGPAVLYHLSKNDDVQERLAQLSPEDQVMEIGVISRELQSRQKKQSSAPAPVSSVKGSSASHTITGNETQAEYEAKRKQQGARWAR